MLLPAAIVAVVLALVLYATSVFQEFSRKAVSSATLALFWWGFVFDLTGTALMSLMTEGFALDFHSVAGLVALALMGGKAVWSSVNYREGSGKRVPPVYTIASGLVWLAVFVAGFFVR